MVDVVIVGAGAAGISAGQALAARGISFVILEASDRIGGRAFTDRTSLPGHWDQGCQWFHCADVNPLVPIAEGLGWDFERGDRTDRAMTFLYGRWQSPEEDAAYDSALGASLDATYEAAKAGHDLPMDQILPNGGKWQPLVRSIFQQIASADPEVTSTLGYADYDDTETNWIVTGGLGTLVERLAFGLPIRTGIAVTAIVEGAGGVRVETSAGAIDARAVLVTASTNVLLSGAIRFGSGSAQTVLDLMQDLPCGAYEKVALAFDRLPIDPSDRLFCNILPKDGDLPFGYQIVAGAHPKLIAHFGGSAARAVDAMSPHEIISLARDGLSAAFGSTATKGILATAVTGWSRNPWIRGAYSYARVGGGTSRKAMIAANSGAVRFAGEAFSLGWYSTVHGAWQSGRDVAIDLSTKLSTGQT